MRKLNDVVVINIENVSLKIEKIIAKSIIFLKKIVNKELSELLTIEIISSAL